MAGIALRGYSEISIILILGAVVAISGCTTIRSSQKNLQPERYQEPEITIDKGVVLSISTNQQKIQERTRGSGQSTYYMSLVTIKILNLTVSNPDNVWMPPALEQGNNVTLLFKRSAEPAQIVRIPRENNSQQTATSSATGNQSLVGHGLEAGAKLISVDKENGSWIFTISDPNITEKQINTLPGVQPGDIIQAKTNRDLTIRTYEVLFNST